MSEPADHDKVRIGTADREAAVKALEVHLGEGRLDLDEYSERSAKAWQARTADELVPLFLDLPLPHAVGDGAAPLGSSPAGSQPFGSSPVGTQPFGPSPVGSSAEAWRATRRHSTGPLGGPLFGRLGETLVALSPFVALLLFFAFGLPWWIFFLIPVSGLVVYGNARDARWARRGRRFF